MAIEKFSLATLASIDQGRVREAFEQALKRCEADCKDRPGTDEARKVTLTAILVPVHDEGTGELESCNVQFQIVESIPKRKSKVYNMASDESGLFFNELSPDQIKQRTLDEPVYQGGPRKAVGDAR